MGQVFRRFVGDPSGSTAIEYALLAALIAMAIIGAVTAIGTQLAAMISGVASYFQ